MIGDVKQGGTMEYGESILDSIHPDEGLEDFEDIEMLDVEEGEFVEGQNSHIDLCQSNKGNAREINPVPISANRKPRNKKKKKNRKKKGIQGSGVTDINRFVLDVCRLLKERKSYLVYAAVGSLGISALSDLVKEVAAIQACGGQKTADGLRFRTGGGILWNMLKTREPNAYREIMKKGKEFEKQFKPSNPGMEKTAAQSAACSFPIQIIASNSDGSPTIPLRQDETEQPGGEGKQTSIQSRIRVPVSYDDVLGDEHGDHAT
ncbi:hypothetical protein Nepgr_014246 [Nepenthes gracilis]|uniref:Phosphorylated adapter RNA export protein n=1 Tax=Nepenthes gracilis TaxID=150966 RepID=A0AAD3XQ91_NEPGR|nr:hypothetical protein Nepgr_014246 [Nepenthes gracilis]